MSRLFQMMVLVALGIVTVLTVGVALADVAGNDDIANAEEAPMDILSTGTVSATDLVDVYKFLVTPGYNLVIDVDVASGLDLRFGILRPEGDRVCDERVNTASGVVRLNHVTTSGGSAKYWYLQVQSENGTYDSTYHFTITATAGVDVEPSDDQAHAVRVPPMLISGRVLGADIVDWYRFMAGGGDVINISFGDGSPDKILRMRLLDAHGNEIVSLVSDVPGTKEESTRTSFHTPLQWFYIEISQQVGGCDYNCSIYIGPQYDAGSGRDAAWGDGLYDVQPGIWYDGETGDMDLEDAYRLSIDPGYVVEVSYKSYTLEDQTLVLQYYTGVIVPGLNTSGFETIELVSRNGELVKGWIDTSIECPEREWSIEVKMADPPGQSGGPYSFHINTVYQGGEDDIGNAEEVQMSMSNTAAVGPIDEMDIFKVLVTPGLNLIINVNVMSGTDMRVWILDPEGDLVCDERVSTASGVVRLNHVTTSGGSAKYWYMKAFTNNMTYEASYHFTITAVSYVDVEPNDDQAHAVRVPPMLISGRVLGADIVDWYRFMAGGGDVINISFGDGSPDKILRMRLLDAHGNEIVSLVSDVPGSKEESIRTSFHTPLQWFYIEISQQVGGCDYNCSIYIGPQYDAGSGRDTAGGDGLYDVLPGIWYDGETGDMDLEDAYRLNFVPGWVVEVSYRSYSVEDQTLVVQYYTGIMIPGQNSSGFETIELVSSQGELVRRWIVTSAETPEHEWFVDVKMAAPPGQSGGRYSFRIGAAFQHEDGQGDAGSSPERAASVESGHRSGYMGGLDEGDCYKFQAGGGSFINISFSPWIEDGVWGITLMQGNISLRNATSIDADWNTISILTAKETPVGWFFIDFMRDGELSSYNWSLAVTSGQGDGGSDGDAAEVLAEGKAISDGSYWCLLGDLDLADCYKLTVSELWTVTANLQVSTSGPLRIELFNESDPRATAIAVQDVQSQMNGTVTVVVPKGTAAGTTLYIRVSSINAQRHGHYSLTLSVDTEEVDIEPPVIVHDPPEKAKEDRDLSINATITDVDENLTVVLYYRMQGDTEWKSQNMTAGSNDNWAGTVPQEDLKTGTLEYYIQATDSEGNEQVYQSGTMPISISVERKKPDDEPGASAVLSTVALAACAALVVIRRRR